MPIFDQGYQHWSGQLSGHAWRWLAITRRGLKTALQGRLVRLALFVSWLPAIVLTFVLCMWGLVERQSEMVDMIKPLLTSLLGRPVLSGPREYRADIWTLCFHYFLAWELWFSMLLVLLVGPNLVSQDLRYNALPLYFSRPLRRIDYFAGKLGVIVATLSLTIIGPAIVAYIFGLLFSLDITILRDTLPILLASVAYGLVIAVSAGLLMLALSSISRNSRYVALLWLGIWVISGTVSYILVWVGQEQRIHENNFGRHAWFTEQFLNKEIEAEKTDWRSLVSYTGNLQRIEERLLKTNASWQRLVEIAPPGSRGTLLQRMLYTQHPWYWSAGVLAVLAALSACTLNLTIRSLDRLK
jgi:ABC-2 type transport system permease protein